MGRAPSFRVYNECCWLMLPNAFVCQIFTDAVAFPFNLQHCTYIVLYTTVGKILHSSYNIAVQRNF